MRLVLIGDVHAYRRWSPPWELLGKPALGQLNLWFNRARHIDLSLLEATLDRAASLRPDMAVFSGDLTTTSRSGEFADVARAIRHSLIGVPKVGVPGNHDHYTYTAVRRRRMEKHLGDMVPARFPHTRDLVGRWRLLALNAARPSLMMARGLVGHSQLEEASRWLSGLREDEGVVAVCHYPFVLPEGRTDRPSHRLCDAREVGEMFTACRARVVYLHGHIHEPWAWRANSGPFAHVQFVNAGAPLLSNRRHPHGQGLWQIDLPDDPRGAVGLVRHHVSEISRGGIEGVEPTWVVTPVQ
ncbi:MAG: metallophosphoesterase [Planctomycetes bacterium]|nr:metallophosphoesterase [Planctomycetota bacterium]